VAAMAVVDNWRGGSYDKVVSAGGSDDGRVRCGDSS